MSEPKFKVGDKVFHVGWGVGRIVTICPSGPYPICAVFQDHAVSGTFTEDGRGSEDHPIPQLLTLEEARAKGYEVPKEIK